VVGAMCGTLAAMAPIRFSSTLARGASVWGCGTRMRTVVSAVSKDSEQNVLKELVITDDVIR
jgi:hypothetical protein